MLSGTTITGLLFQAYIDCPMRCYRLSRGERGIPTEYTAWLQTRKQEYFRSYLRHTENGPERFIDYSSKEDIDTTDWNFLKNVFVSAGNLETTIHLVERHDLGKKWQEASIVPIEFVATNGVSKQDKLLLAFDCFLLSKVQLKDIIIGKIIHGDNYASLNVRVKDLQSETEKTISQISDLLSRDSPPKLNLIPFCPRCEFNDICSKLAIELDDLSLLPSLTDKEKTKLNNQGVTTVTHLSYLFRPRRKSKAFQGKPEKYHHSLKALAIRKQQVHVVGSDDLKLTGTPVYLDVEGIPDRDSYYLIGIRVKNDTGSKQTTLWADKNSEERNIWLGFLEFLSNLENPILVHYGSYETAFFKHMSKRYGPPEQGSTAEQAINNHINLLSFIYARLYFPTYGNGLKEIAKYLGFKWTDPNVLGIHTIMWRSQWERSGDASLKNRLLIYNSEDCEALEHITDFVTKLSACSDEPNESQEIRPVNVKDLPTRRSFIFKKIQFQNSSLEEIYRTGYWDYQCDKITVRSNQRIQGVIRGKDKSPKTRDKPNKVVYWEKPSECPWCGNKELSIHRRGDKTLLDIQFGKSGVKKWVTRYIFGRYYCRACNSPTFSNLNPAWSRPHYGPNLTALAVYLNIGLRISESKTASIFDQLLGINIPGSVIHRFKEKAAEYYSPTYGWILDAVVGGNLIHCDETKIALGNKVGFVWAFTNTEGVAYIYAPNRGGDLIRALLKDFKGVLVSDFYSAYDSVDCPQQKCLIHLIRDLNDELMNEPFNEEMKQLTADFAGLLRSIITTVDRFGLKVRHLHKHKNDVNSFYANLSEHTYETETATRYKKRFEKNRDRLFTFLDYYNVPWNNNNAEHAIKAIAHLRRELGAVSTQRGIEDYLVLLSVRETCKARGINFLDFLRSREIDLDVFRNEAKPYKQKPFLPFDSEAHFYDI
jgi:predicted RecB family nuclease